ncbi:chemotaxis protein CheW [Paenibacillus sp. YYML68]|uniref:chemotaxis protein CheW n=1 Tax=Paenibacillus sp. YYML68 TaxID=2909250 RepID=UPI002493130D|nr:chemotaxis protein CheW [Paenibacillus sp. YYML68]
MDAHLSSYAGLFLDEMEEQLQVLDEKLLELEQGQDAATISSIFRAAHTLKGSAGMMGYVPIEQLTHRLESVFDLLRSGKLELSGELMRVVFESVDMLRLMRQAIVEECLGSVDASACVSRLEGLYTGDPGASTPSAVPKVQGGCDGSGLSDGSASTQPERGEAPGAGDGLGGHDLLSSDSQRAVLEHALGNGLRAFVITVQLEDETPMKSVRALLIFNRVGEDGEIVATAPEVERIEDERTFGGRFSMVLVTSEPGERIEETLKQLSHIKHYELSPYILGDKRLENRGDKPQTNMADEAGAAVLLGDEANSGCQHEGSTGAVGAAASIFRSSSSEVEQASSAAAEARPKPGGDGASEAKLPKQAATVRVDVSRLEHLLNLVGELLIDNTRLHETKKRLHDQLKCSEMDMSHVNGLHDISHHLSRVISELQEGMMKTRMLPIDQLFNRFPRMVRDLADKTSKEIELVIEGRETELDRTLIEEISDPIIHIIRNAGDHGLETPEERIAAGKPRKGRLLLRAEHKANQIVITIADDGRGIDPERIKQASIRKGFITAEEGERMSRKELVSLIFHSGLSTAQEVTNLSGRGVGMDIVRSHIEKLNGLIDIDTKVGQGTVFTIKLPLTLAIIRSLLVKLGAATYAVPLTNVVEIMRIQSSALRTVQGREVVLVRGEVLPLVRLTELLKLSKGEECTEPSTADQSLSIVIVGIAEKRLCLLVDRTIGNQEIVIKSLGAFVGHVPFVSGSTILGGGNVALILDVGAVVREQGASSRASDVAEVGVAAGKRARHVVTFRLATDTFGVTIASVKEIITLPTLSHVAMSSPSILGMVNLRGSLLPVYDLRRQLCLDCAEPTSASRILILETSRQDVGVMVDEVRSVVSLAEDDIEPVDQHAALIPGLLQGIGKTSEGLIQLLDMEKVLGETCARTI